MFNRGQVLTGNVVGGARTIGSPVSRVSGFGTPVAVGGVRTVGTPIISGGVRTSALGGQFVGARAASLSPVSHIVQPTSGLIQQQQVVQAQPQVIGNLGPGVVTSQTVGQPFSLPGRTMQQVQQVQQIQVQQAQPSYVAVQQPIVQHVQPMVVQQQPNIIYQQQPVVSQVIQQPSTFVTSQIQPQTTTTTVVEEIQQPVQTQTVTTVVEEAPQVWDKSVTEVRPSKRRGYAAETRTGPCSPCSPCCVCCPWWFWLLLGLLGLGALAFGLFRFLTKKNLALKTAAGGEAAGGASGATSKSCEAGFFFHDGKCLKCPEGSNWNGSQCIKKKQVEEDAGEETSTSTTTSDSFNAGSTSEAGSGSSSSGSSGSGSSDSGSSGSGSSSSGSADS